MTWAFEIFTAYEVVSTILAAKQALEKSKEKCLHLKKGNYVKNIFRKWIAQNGEKSWKNLPELFTSGKSTKSLKAFLSIWTVKNMTKQTELCNIFAPKTGTVWQKTVSEWFRMALQCKSTKRKWNCSTRSKNVTCEHGFEGRFASDGHC